MVVVTVWVALLVAQVDRALQTAEQARQHDAELDCHVSRAIVSRPAILPGQAWHHLTHTC